MHELATYDLMVLAFGSIAFGFYLLIKGGDWAIDAAVFFAESAGLSKLFVGATILAFGTSIPELFASVNANLSGFPGISLGNVIGSNIANVLLVLGCTAIVYPVMCDPKEIKSDVVMMFVATIAMTVAMQFEVIGRVEGVLFFVALLGFVIYQYKSMTAIRQPVPDFPELAPIYGEDADNDEPSFSSRWAAGRFLLAGFAALALGSELLVKGAVTIGMAVGVPEAIIGMTVVAFGTSLPELATCIAAAAKRHTEMLVGNIIGSNVFNIMSIVGITSMIKPIVVDANLTGLSLGAMFVTSALIGLWFLLGRALSRNIGIAMVALYVGFISVQYI